MKDEALDRMRSLFRALTGDRKKLIRALMIILILMAALILRMHENNKADITLTDNAADAPAGEICVDIGGAVAKPGVYKVNDNTRLFEVIDLAGGLLSNADTDAINRAEYVEDGEKITIPVRYSPSDEYYGQNDTALSSEEIPETAAAQAAPDTGTGSGLININTASREELKTLNGIGDAKADKIIEYRINNRFRSIEDIKKVDGIGESIYGRIKDFITV